MLLLCETKIEETHDRNFETKNLVENFQMFGKKTIISKNVSFDLLWSLLLLLPFWENDKTKYLLPVKKARHNTILQNI